METGCLVMGVLYGSVMVGVNASDNARKFMVGDAGCFDGYFSLLWVLVGKHYVEKSKAG